MRQDILVQDAFELGSRAQGLRIDVPFQPIRSHVSDGILFGLRRLERFQALPQTPHYVTGVLAGLFDAEVGRSSDLDPPLLAERVPNDDVVGRGASWSDTDVMGRHFGIAMNIGSGARLE